jgi:hypothetical protein
VGPGAHDVLERFEKAARLMDEAKEEVLAFSAFPRAQWRQLWSTNLLERLNKELKRRCRVVGIFPTEAALVRLAGAVLSTPTKSGPPPSGAASRRRRWRCCTPSAMMSMRSSASSKEPTPTDRHRGSRPRIPTTWRDARLYFGAALLLFRKETCADQGMGTCSNPEAPLSVTEGTAYEKRASSLQYPT